MRVKIFLHGHLRDKINKDFVETEALTVFDALQSLANTYKDELKAPLDIGRWKVKVKGYETKESWYVPILDKEIHIYPVFRTAKSKWLGVIVGTTLAVIGAVTYMVPGGQAAGTFLMKTGLAIAVSGLLTALYPTPKMDTSESNGSKYLGAQGNTTAAGTRIPFGYGLFKISGHFISYNISSTVIRETD